MDPERWKHVRRIVLEAQELSREDERIAFLDEACGEDAELRQEVESFLNADLEKVGFMELPQMRLLGEELPPLQADSQVGAYRIQRQLGSGGMGIVYLATRVGDEFKREVAIKVLRAGPAGQTSEQAEQRFRQEMEILANLDHPNIAKLYEGGRAEDGRLYYLMEYIEGQPIDVYCRQQKLSLEQRLRLFQKVCAAVQYAHTQLVVHRDLKPSNVLVNAKGEPKLLDFGVAKPLEGAGIGDTILTGGDQRLFTPDYASPEQVIGKDIHIASDVYSLGILLYELLAGDRPYRLKALAELEIQRVVCDETPVPPSTALLQASNTAHGEDSPTTDPTTATFRRRLQGDLDTIVLMALRKAPRDRYSTVQQFVDDVGRHLDGQPILARKPSWSYRSKKFLRRHPGKITAAIATLTLSIGFGVAMARQRDEVVRERDLAEHRLRQSQITRSFLVNLFRSADPDQVRGGALTAKELLEIGSKGVYEDFSQEPEVRAEIAGIIGEIHLALGSLEKADGPLVAATKDTRRIFGETSAQHASALNTLATLRQEQGKYDISEALFRQALDIRLSVLGEQHSETAVSLSNLATILWLREDLAGAEVLDRRALAIHRTAYGGDHRDLASSIENLAILLDARGKAREAEPLYREAMAMRRRLFKEPHSHLAISLANYGLFLHHQGNLTEARTLYEQSVAMRRQVLGKRHPSTRTVVNNLATLLWLQGDLCAAQMHLENALRMARQALGNDAPEVANRLGHLAKVHRDKGSLGKAEELIRESLVVKNSVFGPDGLNAADALFTLGSILLEKRDLDESHTILSRSLQIREQNLGSTHRLVAEVRLQLALLECERGDYRASKELAETAISTLKEVLPATHWQHSNAKSILGCSLTGLGEYAAAESVLLESFNSLNAEPGRLSPTAIRALRRAIGFYRQSGQIEKAMEHELEFLARKRTLSTKAGCGETSSPRNDRTEAD